MTAHLVFLRSGVVLAKRPQADWRSIQDEFDDYMTSLGPWTVEEMLDYFEHEYGKDTRWPVSRDHVVSFFASDATTLQAT